MIFISDTSLHSNLHVRTVIFLEDTQFEYVDFPLEVHQSNNKKLFGNIAIEVVVFPKGLRLDIPISEVKLLNGSIICL